MAPNTAKYVGFGRIMGQILGRLQQIKRDSGGVVGIRYDRKRDKFTAHAHDKMLGSYQSAADAAKRYNEYVTAAFGAAAVECDIEAATSFDQKVRGQK